MTISLTALEIRALLLDIEGTTTPVEFVYQVLFPYARAHAAEYLARNQDSAECGEAVALLRSEQTEEGTLEYAFSLMDRDKKSPGLKALQGLIWRDGYKSGELRGQVYPDVLPAFKRWRARGREIFIYSSGSVLAQQLLFGSTNAGDLTPFLGGYFDTAVGPKVSEDSYRVIAQRVHVPPAHILFVSDVGQELDAARTSGMRTALCVRGSGEVPPGSALHPTIRTFDEIVD